MHLTVLLALLLLFPVAGATAPASSSPSTISAARLQGRYDNKSQESTGRGPEAEIPRVAVTIEPTPLPDFALWHVRIETDPQTSYEQTWAMQARIEHDGSGALVPYYQLHQDARPDPATFDPGNWLSLEACALRGRLGATTFEGMAEGEPCVAVSMSIGARRALLPVGVRVDGAALAIDFNLRGERTHVALQRAH